VVLTTLVDIGLIEPVSDMKPVRKMVKFLLEEFTEKPVDFQMFNQIKEEIYIMFEQQPFRLPAQMMFIFKVFNYLGWSS
jgi:Predicted unusual protein kinase